MKSTTLKTCIAVAIAAICLLLLSGCCSWCKKHCHGGPCAKPELSVSDAVFDASARTVSATIRNDGATAAGSFLVYIEVNRIDAPESAKPEAQYSTQIASLGAGQSTVIGNVPLSDFSARPTIDLATVLSLDLVVRADPKGQVMECDETNNTLEREIPRVRR